VSDLDGLLVWAWLIASALCVGLLGASVWRLARMRCDWREAVIAGVPVLVSHDVGPAVIGIIHHGIVVPEWVETLDDDAQRAVMTHEREHVRAEIGAFLAASDLDSAELLRRLRSVGDAVRDNVRHRGAHDGNPANAAPADLPTLLEAVQTPEQRAILNRLTAVMTLLEGHGEYVMNGVGPSVIPSVEEIGRKFSERRRGQNPADRLVRKLFGLDMKAKQYAEGATFVRAAPGLMSKNSEPARASARVSRSASGSGGTVGAGESAAPAVAMMT